MIILTRFLGSTRGVHGVSWGLGSDIVATGDYDGDAKTDQAVVRRNGTTWDWYILQSSNNQYRLVNFGLADTDLLVQNDYDGDGKTDIAVRRETDNTFYVLKSTDSNFLATTWGLISDLPVAAYDTH